MTLPNHDAPETALATDAELLPCPWCDSRVELKAEEIFVCTGCGANVSLYAPDPIAAWNRRARLSAAERRTQSAEKPNDGAAQYPSVETLAQRYPEVLAAHAQFGGDLKDMLRRYEDSSALRAAQRQIDRNGS